MVKKKMIKNTGSQLINTGLYWLLKLFRENSMFILVIEIVSWKFNIIFLAIYPAKTVSG